MYEKTESSVSIIIDQRNNHGRLKYVIICMSIYLYTRVYKCSFINIHSHRNMYIRMYTYVYLYICSVSIVIDQRNNYGKLIKIRIYVNM
jgi:hypothetical protein